MSDAPADVVALAEERAAARAAKDYSRSDELRDAIAAAGWLVTDTPDGFALAAAPPFPLLSGLDGLPVVGEGAGVVACVLIDGWPDDARTCIEALVAHGPDDLVVAGLDLGDVDGAGRVLHDLAAAHPGRVVDLHLASSLAQVGWARALTALIEACAAPAAVVLDPSTVLDGDAITPLLAELADPSVVAAGWRGVNVDLDDNWRSFVDAGPGEVDALLGYLFVVSRDAAVATPSHPKAKFYRNADMEWCLALREAGGRLVAAPGRLPVHQERHRGYHDSDPEYRDRESKRTYDRLLQRFRGRTDLLAPRPS